ncbi:MAG: DEAD/DEAH box helicase family protein [Lentisphaerae bacterium]|nr:DEAD/DEAH box helicase family protein [Lentisphaerota bacterium]
MMNDLNSESALIKSNPSRTEKPISFDIGCLPREVQDIVLQLLVASGNDELMKLADTHIRKLSYSLSNSERSEFEQAEEAFFKVLRTFQFEINKRELLNPVDYAQVDPFLVGEWFKPDGEFQRAMPEYEFRKEQFEMASAVAEAFNSQSHLVVEAGTGTGKTMAYLVPSVLWALANKVPVVLSTNTKNLQEQIFYKDLPLVAKIIRTPFRATVIKGRRNYICLSRLEYLLSNRETELTEEQMLPLAEACVWVFNTATGDLSELSDANKIADKLASNSEECRGRKCVHFNRCFLQRARSASLNADVIITNHSVYFSEPEDKVIALPKHAQVVFDEAHNMEEAATRFFQKEITAYSFLTTLRKIRFARRSAKKSLQKELKETGFVSKIKTAILENKLVFEAEHKDFVSETIDKIAKQAEKTRSASISLLLALGGILHPGETVLRLRPEFLQSRPWLERLPLLNDLQDSLFELVSSMEKIESYFNVQAGQTAPEEATAISYQNRDHRNKFVSETVSEFSREASIIVEALQRLVNDLEFITSGDDGNWVYWVSGIRERGTNRLLGGLFAAPVDISEYLAKSLFEKKETVVLCSATMNVSGSSKFIANRIGLGVVEPERIMSLCVGSSFDFERQCLAAVPEFLPDVAGANVESENLYVDALADFVGRLAVVTKGRMLVLFTSYRMMTQCAAGLEPLLQEKGVRVLMQGSGFSRERITKMFREDVPSVLLGTDSFWEGVDLIGEALSCLVIARLPFDAVNDPVVSARSERVAQLGGSSFKDFALPNAIIKFRQGFGRLIRHNDDRGVIVVADQRIVTKGYGAQFRKNLPVKLKKISDSDELLKMIGDFL